MNNLGSTEYTILGLLVLEVIMCGYLVSLVGKMVNHIIILYRGESLRINSSIRTLARSINESVSTGEFNHKEIESAIRTTIVSTRTDAMKMTVLCMCILVDFVVLLKLI